MPRKRSVKVKCPECGYVWITKSKLNYVICPNCRKLFNKYEHRLDAPSLKRKGGKE